MTASVIRRCRRHGLVRGRCPACEAERGAHDAARRSANNVRLGRNSAHWRRLRRARLALASHLCELGLSDCTVTATTVDLMGGGDHSTAQLEDTRAACRSCHGRVDGGRR